jgi:hypothetical protein
VIPQLQRSGDEAIALEKALGGKVAANTITFSIKTIGLAAE